MADLRTIDTIACFGSISVVAQQVELLWAPLIFRNGHW
jgi:hypothetical protein